MTGADVVAAEESEVALAEVETMDEEVRVAKVVGALTTNELATMLDEDSEDETAVLEAVEIVELIVVLLTMLLVASAASPGLVDTCFPPVPKLDAVNETSSEDVGIALERLCTTVTVVVSSALLVPPGNMDELSGVLVDGIMVV